MCVCVCVQALQQMEAQTPLPVLFMRSVITAHKALPRLRRFIGDLLSRLISKQVRGHTHTHTHTHTRRETAITSSGRVCVFVCVCVLSPTLYPTSTRQGRVHLVCVCVCVSCARRSGVSPVSGGVSCFSSRTQASPFTTSCCSYLYPY